MLLLLHSPNLRQTREFYALLGLSFVDEQHDQGPAHVAVQIPNTIFEIYPTATDALPATSLGFYVSNREKLVAQLVAAGGELAQPLPSPLPPNRSILIKDPDGRPIRLFQSL